MRVLFMTPRIPSLSPSSSVLLHPLPLSTFFSFHISICIFLIGISFIFLYTAYPLRSRIPSGTSCTLISWNSSCTTSGVMTGIKLVSLSFSSSSLLSSYSLFPFSLLFLSSLSLFSFSLLFLSSLSLFSFSLLFISLSFLFFSRRHH